MAVHRPFPALDWSPALQRPDLLAPPVAAALRVWARLEPHVVDRVLVTPINPALADTAAFTEAYRLPLQVSATCIVVIGRRGGAERTAAAVVLATTRVDVNGVVRRRLDVRKASFLSTERTVAETGMEYGGITPIGLPPGWPTLIDARIAAAHHVIVGSGLRRSKLTLPGDLLGRLPGAEVADGLAVV